ncbi:MAG: hypothetical protein ACRCUH_15405, partial [Shewanella sp.]
MSKLSLRLQLMCLICWHLMKNSARHGDSKLALSKSLYALLENKLLYQVTSLFLQQSITNITETSAREVMMKR